MNSIDELAGQAIVAFPPLRQSQPEIADRGIVRLGSACISAGFPPLR